MEFVTVGNSEYRAAYLLADDFIVYRRKSGKIRVLNHKDFVRLALDNDGKWKWALSVKGSFIVVKAPDRS